LQVCSIAIVWGGCEQGKTEARNKRERPPSLACAVRNMCLGDSLPSAHVLCFPSTDHDFCVFSSYICLIHINIYDICVHVCVVCMHM